MEKNNRNNRKRHNWNNSKGRGNNNNFSFKNKNRDFRENQESNKFHYIPHESIEALQKREEAIQEFKEREIICPACGQIITDVASAVADKKTGEPVHFECVMAQLEQTEKVGQNEKICYIGQGRFGILYFENPRDQRHFTIKKIIDWEEREKNHDWRNEISSLYSKVE